MDEYISRETVLNLIEHNDKVCHYADERYENVVYATTQTICKVVAEMPAADVQRVKHGRWLPSDSYITAAYSTIHCQICSECGADLMEDSDYDYDFCPVCGARMDLKDGDAE